MGKKKDENVAQVENKILTDVNGKKFEIIPFTREGETPELFKINELEDEIDRLVTLAISGIRSKRYYSSRYNSIEIYREEQEVYELADKLREKIRG